MIRNPELKKIKEIYTIFKWNECDSCKYEFRREIGFKVRTDHELGFGMKWTCYLCEKCGESPESALETSKRLSPWPPPPSPPEKFMDCGFLVKEGGKSK